MARRPSKATSRLRRLVALGLAKTSDYVKRGRIDKAAQDRLRRLAQKIDRGGLLRRYVSSTEYTFVRVTGKNRATLRGLAPKELRRLNLKAIPIRLGSERVRKGRGFAVVPRGARQIRTLKDGTHLILFKNGSREYHIPVDPLKFAVDSDALIQPVVAKYVRKFGTSRVRFRLRWGFGGQGEGSDLFEDENFAKEVHRIVDKYRAAGVPDEELDDTIEAIVVEVLPTRKKGRRK